MGDTSLEKLVLFSNRGPYAWRETPTGWERVKAIGGLTSTFEPLLTQKGGSWVAWNGREGEEAEKLPSPEGAYHWQEVSLDAEEVKHYYHGFANGALWPLCHYLVDKCRFEHKDWGFYVRVNKKFAEVARKEIGPQRLAWVQDYHLALLPYYLRKNGTAQKIAFFWHIPFPQDEVFQILPWAPELLRGMLGSDLIGFHVEVYQENFLTAVEKILGAEVNWANATVNWQKRKVLVRALPIGVDFGSFQAWARDPATQAKAKELQKQIGTEFTGLGVDRLDYTKGITVRLLALEKFWEMYPQYRGRFSFVQIGVPSREEVPAYQELRKEVEETVSRINGKYGRIGWTPIYYFSQAFTQEELAAYYLLADLALVTPLRDGLNLVAKEYMATRLEGGALILSRFAGAAQELKEALLVNPYHLQEVACQIKRALEIPWREKEKRRQVLQRKIRAHDLYWWLETFLNTLVEPEAREVLVLQRKNYPVFKFPKAARTSRRLPRNLL